MPAPRKQLPFPRTTSNHDRGLWRLTRRSVGFLRPGFYQEADATQRRPPDVFRVPGERESQPAASLSEVAGWWRFETGRSKAH